MNPWLLGQLEILKSVRFGTCIFPNLTLFKKSSRPRSPEPNVTQAWGFSKYCLIMGWIKTNLANQTVSHTSNWLKRSSQSTICFEKTLCRCHIGPWTPRSAGNVVRFGKCISQIWRSSKNPAGLGIQGPIWHGHMVLSNKYLEWGELEHTSQIKRSPRLQLT